MNSLTVYALGIEMARVLADAKISRIDIFDGGATFHLQKALFAFLHLLYHGRERELFPGKARIASTGNCREGMRSLKGARITGLKPLGMERVLLLKLESFAAWDEGADFRLRINLMPSGNAAALFPGDGKRGVDSIGPERLRSDSSPEDTAPQKRLSVLSMPANPPDDFLESIEQVGPMDLPDHTKALSRAKRAAEWLVESVGGIDPVMAREVARVHGGDPKEIWTSIGDIGRAAAEGGWSWRLYDLPRSGRSILYPVALPIDAPATVFPGCIEALGAAADRIFIPSYTATLKSTVKAQAAAGLKRLEKLSSNIAGDISQAERSQEYRHLGNLLVTHRHLMKTGMPEISMKDFSGDRMITIPLDPAKPPDKNIQGYFKRAKKGEKGILILRTRRRAVERELSQRKKALAEIERITDPDALLSLIPPGLDRSGRRTAEKATRFRRFELDGCHTVLVGRSNQENDLLTHRFASPGDLWFHAQGVPGSHVILKGASPSTAKKIIERAAAIAAYYSKARHSTTVPVVYTEKRYVRKPKKSKPGTAVCLRSKTLFVKPDLPGTETAE
jgi:hypothetical protein